MALYGKDLVAIIQGTLESTSRRDQQDIRERMAKESVELLSRYELESRALEAFDLLRKNEVKFGTARENARGREEGVAKDLMGWGVGSFGEALDLADKLHDRYKTFRTEFLNTRSITAHVGAVLRPFKRRYLEGWAEAGINNFNLESTEAEVERLSSMVINTEDELRTWSKLVYRLFLSVAVLRDDIYRTSSPTEQKPRKPMGMISSGSERTYNQQWTTWVDDNIQALLAKSSSFGSFDVPTGFMQSSGFSQLDRDSNYNQFAYSSTPVQAPVAAMPAQALASGVVVRITDSTDSSLTAERVWIDKVSAIADVPKWVKNLLVFWGEGRSVSIQLEFALPSGESKFSLPATVLDSSSDRIVSVLNAEV